MQVDVALVRWPIDEARRRELAEQRRPRLLLVAAGADPPICIDDHEDWVRLPVSDGDARARVRALQARVHGSTSVVPSLDGDGMLRYRAMQLELSPLQSLLMGPLIDRFGIVVGREALMDAAWPDRETDRNILDVHMLRLRRRLDPMGLQIRTVRSRGYLLTGSEATILPT